MIGPDYLVTIGAIVGALVGGGIAAYKLTIYSVKGFKQNSSDDVSKAPTIITTILQCQATTTANIAELMRGQLRIETQVKDLWDHLENIKGR